MLSEPEDYGLTAAQTLEHRLADDTVPNGFDAFWAETCEALSSHPASFRKAGSSGIVQFESFRSVRINGRLTVPEGAVDAVIITSHGYGNVADDFAEQPVIASAPGAALLEVRVRGYPPSIEEIGDLRDGWIMHRIESAQTWIVRGAVCDIMQAARCARTRFGNDVAIFLHGESLGAGLAVMAAAQLARLNIAVDRLVIGLPSLGDWRWRAGRYCNGAGGEINPLIESFRQESRAFIERLCLLDAALHGRFVSCPALCKLAQRDDVVPAPSAAAVYHSLGSDEKWRFVTRYGHFDGGIADARRHVVFDQLISSALDPQQDLADVMQDVECELRESRDARW
ncbi:MAG: acetylxylan esterase [Phycisphaerales bacterium]